MPRKYKHAIQPWESTEQIFTDGARDLGMSKTLSFEPVLDSLPARTIALILIYPTPSDYEEQKKAEEATSLRHLDAQVPTTCNAMWLSQRVQNACGPYALLHAVFNSDARHHLRELDLRTSSKLRLITLFIGHGSVLHKLQESLLKASSQEARNTAVEEDLRLWERCSAIGRKGDTSLLEDAEEDVEYHYVCFAGSHGMLAMFDSDSISGPKDLDMKLEPQGLMPDQIFEFVKNHLDTYGGEQRDFSVLLALVDNSI